MGRSFLCGERLVFAAEIEYTKSSKSCPGVTVVDKGGFLMLKSIRNSLILTSLLYVILGLMLLMMPELSLGFACLLIGGVTIFYGVVRIVAYVRGGANGDKFDLFVGVLLVLLGLFLLVWTRFLVALIPVVLGIYIMIDSFTAIKKSLDMKALGFQNWWISCLVAGVLAICGLVMVLNPFSTVEALVMFIGLGFLLDGVYTLVNTILYERLFRN